MELVDCPTGLVTILSLFYCPHQSIGIWMEENSSKKTPRKAFGVKSRGKILGNSEGYGVQIGDLGGIQEASEHPCCQQLRDSKCCIPIKGGRGCTSQHPPALLI